MFQYFFSSSTASEISLEKPAGTVDLDVRYSPNEAELIIMNTSNDGVSTKNIVKCTPVANNSAGVSRTIIFANASMPDWE